MITYHKQYDSKILTGKKPVCEGYGANENRKLPPDYKNIQICLTCALAECVGEKRCKKLKGGET